jgi:glycosyltransferase involved in cell wall biosynthesis
MRGGQWQAWFLIEGLRDRGVDCILLAPGGAPLAVKAKQAGVNTHRLSLNALWRLSRETDITHAHTGRAHTLAAVAAGNPVVVARRVAFPVKRGPGSRWKYRQASRYIAVSEHVKQILLAADVPSKSVSVVYDGVPALEPVRNGSRVVAPAFDDPRKGSALAREAAKRAQVELEFATDLEAGLRDAAMLVYITDLEGLGSGALLAMSAGLPVVASRVGGLPEVVDHEETGLLVENEPDAIAASIRTLMNDPIRRAGMGASGRKKVMSNFTLEHMVTRTEKVYREVLG